MEAEPKERVSKKGKVGESVSRIYESKNIKNALNSASREHKHEHKHEPRSS